MVNLPSKWIKETDRLTSPQQDYSKESKQNKRSQVNYTAVCLRFKCQCTTCIEANLIRVLYKPSQNTIDTGILPSDRYRLVKVYSILTKHHPLFVEWRWQKWLMWSILVLCWKQRGCFEASDNAIGHRQMPYVPVLWPDQIEPNENENSRAIDSPSFSTSNVNEAKQKSNFPFFP